MHNRLAVIPRRGALRLGLCGALLGAGSGAAIAQPSPVGVSDPARGPPTDGWPDRPVRMITTGAPGTGVDLGARLLAEGLARRFGQPFAVENRAGADGILAAEAHARARPGDSLLFSFPAVAAVTPFLHDRLPYDAEADLVPVASAVAEFHAFVVPASMPVTDLAGLVALAGERPGSLNWYGAVGLPYLTFRLFLHDRGVDMAFISYRSIVSATLDLAVGRIQLVFGPASTAVGLIREGRVRALAVAGHERAPSLPGVPTVAEAGFPELRAEAVYGVFGWRGIGDATRDRLATEMRAVVAEPPIVERLRAAGALPRPGTPAEFAAMVGDVRARAANAVRAFGSVRSPD